jgi:hypothetical protein
VTTQEVVEEVLDRGMLEVLPLTHIRGRSLHDAFVIVDEAQSLERNVLLTVLSRIGQRLPVVLTHDVAQRDNLRVGRHDGVVAVVEKLKGHPLFAHVTLTRSERSPIAALVTEMLEDLPAKKSLPLSSTTMNAGKSSTSIRQTASMPSSGYSRTSTFLMQSWASRAAGPPIEPR